jgi:hypothetical protein
MVAVDDRQVPAARALRAELLDEALPAASPARMPDSPGRQGELLACPRKGTFGDAGSAGGDA